MNKLFKDAKLVGLELQPEEKATFDFLAEDEGLLLEVVWNFKKFDPDTRTWYPSQEQREMVEEWAKEYFDCNLLDLANVPTDGSITKDVYHYGTFNSLWEVVRVVRFEKERKGERFDVTIDKIERTNKGIQIYFEEGGELRAVNFSTSKYIEGMGYITDPVQEIKALTKFKDRFGVDFEDADVLIGETMNVGIEVAFGKFPYADPSTFSQQKKEELQAKLKK